MLLLLLSLVTCVKKSKARQHVEVATFVKVHVVVCLVLSEQPFLHNLGHDVEDGANWCKHPFASLAL